MKKAINKETIYGRIYDKSKLTLQTVKNKDSKNFGQEYISGSLDIATDSECMNIVTVYFTFVQPTFKSGKTNSNWGVLKNIIENGKAILTDGDGMMVRVDGSLGLNDFYTARNGETILVAAKRNQASFISTVTSLPKSYECATFECDMLINGTEYVEANPERHIECDFLKIKGAVFDFKNAILPVEFVVKDKDGINYFENLDASPQNLIFTKVSGIINNVTTVDKREEESAFGQPIVKEYPRTIREWVVNSAAKMPYEIGDPDTGITAEEIKKALADRETYLAEIKGRYDAYQQSIAQPAATAPAAAGGFNF